MNRALFLDRDGVINVDHGYVHQAGQFDWLPGIFDLARSAQALELKLIVVTNQAGIARGMYDEEAFHALTRWMCARFEQEGAPLAQVYFCPTHPTAGVGKYRVDSECRKPRPGMILQAAREHALNLPECFLLGDSMSDVHAGQAAGVGRNLLLDADAAPLAPNAKHWTVPDLTAAQRFLLNPPARIPLSSSRPPA